jgi:hypothetical protein
VRSERLCSGGDLSVENRNGLCADFRIHDPMTRTESMLALEQIQPHQKLHPGTRMKKILGSLRSSRYRDRVWAQAWSYFLVGT